jgi:hypothetical protein
MLGARRTGMCLIGINLKRKEATHFWGHRNYRKETFLLNTNLQLKEMENEITKLQEIITTDAEIISLREYRKISWCATTKWRNYFLWVFGRIDKFIRIKTNQKLHEIQLLLAKANYNVIKGN